MSDLSTFKLSDQAMGAIMMALQRSLLEQSDIVPVLRALKFVQQTDDQLIVINPPIVKGITRDMLEEEKSDNA